MRKSRLYEALDSYSAIYSSLNKLYLDALKRYHEAQATIARLNKHLDEKGRP